MYGTMTRRRLLAGGCLGLLAVGCNAGAKDYSAYVPASDSARKALQASLDAWKAGRPLGRVEARPPIDVLDSKWRAGQKLTAYEITKEEPSEGVGPRWFTVKLTTSKGAQEVRYAVVGNDPLWVYSEDEYNKVSGVGAKSGGM